MSMSPVFYLVYIYEPCVLFSIHIMRGTDLVNNSLSHVKYMHKFCNRFYGTNVTKIKVEGCVCVYLCVCVTFFFHTHPL